MINATAPTDELLRRLSARAAEKAKRHGTLITTARERDSSNWRDPRALWPNLRLD